MFVFLVISGCAHRPPACLRTATRAEITCLQSNETKSANQITNNVNTGFFTSNTSDFITKCKLLYKLVYKECVLAERAGPETYKSFIKNK